VGYIAFASAKGSPGVTTAVAALAATWPADRELVVAEVDPAGGDLVVRFDLATEPGLVSLAAAGRRELGPDTLLAHTQELAGLAHAHVRPRRALVAPVSADQAAAALTALRGALSTTLAALDTDVLVDCGRLDPQSPAFEVATRAELLVMVTQPVVAEVHHLAARLATVRSATAVSVLLVGERPYSVSEVAEAVGANPLGTLPADGRSAAALAGGHVNVARALRRSGLLRDAGAIAAGLAEWLGPAPGAPRATDPSAAPPVPSPGAPAALPSAAAPAPPPVPPGASPPGPPAPAPRVPLPPVVAPAPAGPPRVSPLLPAPRATLPPPSGHPPAPDAPPVVPGPPPAAPVGAPSAGPAGDQRDAVADPPGRLRANVRRERPPSPPAKHFRRDDAEERRR
jgi:MinD-like ATPase involved in chromosome partitioning or flagellar assembly